jgi:hypothetical protein
VKSLEGIRVSVAQMHRSNQAAFIDDAKAKARVTCVNAGFLNA